MSKELRKYITFLKYFDKSLIFLSVTSSTISIGSFVIVIGALAEIASSNFSLVFSMSRCMIKKR